MHKHVGLFSFLAATAVSAALGLTASCGSDSDDNDAAGSGGDSGSGGEGGSGGGDAGSGGSGGDAGSGGSGGSVDPVERGAYLVNTVSICIGCHMPFNPDGSPDMDNFLAGVDCFVDIDPTDDAVGCIATPNLTDHETGLANRSDDEIKDMFMTGVRPDGKALHDFMPYWMYGNMTEDDADAIVAYLRTVEGVDHQVAKHQPPWDVPPEEPLAVLDLDEVPTPSADDENYESALNGRYLATSAAPCIECHTMRTEPGSASPIDLAMAFAGGGEFTREELGLPDNFPEIIYSRNLTSDATGLEEWTADDIVTALKEGVNPDDKVLCPPMPAGPMGPFGNLTDEDAMDIANYLLTLPGIENELPECNPTRPAPNASRAGNGSRLGEQLRRLAWGRFPHGG